VATKVVGGVAADLVLRTAAWHSGFTRARRDVGTFKSAINDSLKNIVGFVAVGMALRKVVAEFNETRKAIDSLAKTSDRLGLSTETLAGFNFAAKIAGASTESVTTALTFMAKTIGEASEKGGEYEEVLQRIGLTSSQLMALSPEQQYRQIAQGISEMGTAAEKTAATMRIFGRGGNDIAALITGGPGALDAAIAKTREYGTAISREAAAQVELMNDRLTTAGELWDGLTTQLTTVAAVAFNGLVDITDELITKSEQVGKTWADNVRDAEGYAPLWASILGVTHKVDVQMSTLRDMSLPQNQTDVSGTNPTRLREGLAAIEKEYARLDAARISAEQKIVLDAEKRIQTLTAAAMDSVELDRQVSDIVVQIEAEKNAQLAELRNADMEDWKKKSDEKLQKIKDDAREQAALAQQLAAQELAFRNEVVQGSLGLMSALAAGEDQQTRKGFERAKKYAIAQVSIDTAAAIMNIWKSHAGHPIRAGVLTALAVATGAAQIANIRKTSFDGGGGVSAPSLGMAGGEGVSGGGPRMINLTLSGGGRYSTEEVIGLMEQFGEQMADGYKIAVSGG